MSNLVVSSFKTEGITFNLTADALEQKSQALIAAEKIQDIATVEQMEEANPVIRMLAGLLKDLEKSRKEVKAPITKLGKDIDAVANDFKLSLEEQDARLRGLVSLYVEKQRKAQLKDIRKTGSSEVDTSGGGGIATVDVWDFEITNLEKAYKESPGLFELVPKRAAILAAGKAGLSTPHIRVFKTTGVRIQA